MATWNKRRIKKLLSRFEHTIALAERRNSNIASSHNPAFRHMADNLVHLLDGRHKIMRFAPVFLKLVVVCGRYTQLHVGRPVAEILGEVLGELTVQVDEPAPVLAPAS